MRASLTLFEARWALFLLKAKASPCFRPAWLLSLLDESSGLDWPIEAWS